jgi:hypothetical protein
VPGGRSLAIEGTYAHESGHNYGFEHANARVGSRCLEYYGVYYDSTKRLSYGPGVTVNAVHDGSGDDVMADASGDTSFGAGSSWSDGSGRLTVTVTRVGLTGADVRVDYEPAKELASSKPVITGSAKVGRTLTARHRHWTAGTTFSYAWWADGKRLKHETARKLTLTKAQRGSRIRVEMIGSKPGFRTVSRTSARTRRVR